MGSIFFYILLVLVVFQDTEGHPKLVRTTNQLNLITDEYVNSLLNKALEANQTLSNARAEYNERMDSLNNKLTAEGKTLGADSSCKDLESSMDQAQIITNNAALLALQATADISTVVTSAKDCFSNNIFSIMSCSAHKLQEGRNIYIKYKPEMADVDVKLASAMKKLFSDLVNCFKKVNS